MLTAFLIAPFAAAAAAAAVRPPGARQVLTTGFALAHLGATLAFWGRLPEPAGGGAVALDELGLLFLTVTSALFALVSLYSPAYHRHEGHVPGRLSAAASLCFLGAMALVCCSHHFGLLWVAVEATTLASAPLIAQVQTPRSLEAVWKYLVICSVGIALALLGTFFLGLSAFDAGGEGADFTFPALVAAAPRLSLPWLKGAFVLLLAGYGTKMGLFPFHAWLPDAHSEAPSPVSALLSGALLNCAFLGLLRVVPVVAGAGLGDFARDLFVALGLLSLAVAAVFIFAQTDVKRMLAYSSIEHMGVLALGVGAGGLGSYGALLHAVNHSVGKALLFLAAGNLVLFSGTKSVERLAGASRRVPLTAALFAAGVFAIAGSPPFGAFLSEFTILRALVDGGRLVAGGAYLLLLGIVFSAMVAVALRVLHGPAPERESAVREPLPLLVPPLVLAALSLALGVHVPRGVESVLQSAARLLGG